MMSSKPRILYIEDDPASCIIVDRTLRYAGYDVVMVERGLDGIDIARNNHIDLVLTDINLPDITGRELATMLRSDPRYAKTPIVAVTASDYGDSRELAIAAGLTGYLTKPLDIEQLPRQVAYYLEGGRDTLDEETLNTAQTRYTQELVQRLEVRLRELEAYSKDLERVDEIKNAFLQITAHELRTPLTLINGYARLLHDAPEMQAILGGQSNLGSTFSGLLTAIERMQAIINEILTVSRIMTHQIELGIGAVNLISLLEKVVANYQDILKTRRLSLKVEVNTFPRSIRADADLFRLVLDNLMSNAIKYTPDGGQIRIFAQHDESIVTVVFKDNGIGIPPEDLEHIFESFYTGNDPQFHSTSKTAFAGGGLGLGLTIVRGIIEAHGGTVIARSTHRDRENPPGSEFIITLPMNVQAPRPRLKNLATGRPR